MWAIRAPMGLAYRDSLYAYLNEAGECLCADGAREWIDSLQPVRGVEVDQDLHDLAVAEIDREGPVDDQTGETLEFEFETEDGFTEIEIG